MPSAARRGVQSHEQTEALARAVLGHMSVYDKRDLLGEEAAAAVKADLL